MAVIQITWGQGLDGSLIQELFMFIDPWVQNSQHSMDIKI